MYGTLILAAALVVASADVSHLGYHYKVPQTSYGIPSYQFGSSSGRYNPTVSGAQLKGSEGQYLGSTVANKDVLPSASSITGFGSGLNGYNGGLESGLNGVKYIQSVTPSSNNGFYATSTAAPFSGQYYKVTPGYSTGQYNQQYVTPASSIDTQYYQGPSTVAPIYVGDGSQYASQYETKYQQYYQVQQQAPQVYKHFYVHSAPEEPELPKPRTPIVLPPPQKHYKIIFVKTPNVASRTSQIVPVQPQNEEKTIVYVLVQKPEEKSEVILPKVEQKPPSKPEVYFIKYNNKDDSQAVINNIVSDYSKDGQTVSVANAGSQDTPVYSGAEFYNQPSFPSSSISSLPNYPSVTSFSNFPSSSISSVPSYPSVTSFSNFPSSSGVVGSGSSLGSGFLSGSAPSSSSGFSSGSGFLSGTAPASGSALSSGSVFGSSGSSQPSTSSGSGLFSDSSKTPSSSFGTSSFNSDASPGSVSLVDSGSSGSAPSGTVSATFSPLVSTTTPSTVVYDDANTISTSQGVPHESYGPPKFRAN